MDEIWSFVYSKEKNALEAQYEDAGDVWTWTALCADTKLITSWCVGPIDSITAHSFIRDLAGRMANRIQLSSDGYRPYLEAIEGGFGDDIDFGMLIKIYGDPPKGTGNANRSSFCIGAKKKDVTGNPDEKHISTSFVERQNLTMRMGMRRFTRSTNGFSKKIENHIYAIALHFMFYNYGRVHKTLRVTPAMEARISDHVWTLEEIASLADSN